MADNDNYTNVLLEEIRSQMQAVLEIVSDNQHQINKITGIETGVQTLQSDMNIVKEGVQQTSQEIRLLDKRVTKLETKLV